MSNISSVRITKIIIKNFKNVLSGEISLINSLTNSKASVLGLYGQNGSGKTALIESLDILKHLFCGRPLPKQFVNFININAESAKLEFEFQIRNSDSHEEYSVSYSFSLGKSEDTSSGNTLDKNDKEKIFKPVIYDECIKYSMISLEENISRRTLIDTKSEDIAVPKSTFSVLVGKDEDGSLNKELSLAKALAYEESTSFIFSRRLVNHIRKACQNDRFSFLIERLIRYGRLDLFVISTQFSGVISLDNIIMSFRIRSSNYNASGTIPLSLDGACNLSDEEFKIISSVVASTDKVLSSIVPESKIELVDFGSVVCDNGKPGRRVQLVSNKNGKPIPLKYESEGIKKIISILQLLIAVYGDDSITVAIDELDSGIFEYLLGELLNIISEEGKGQLIFTSHNLRPLEILNQGFLAFTTTEPENRYKKYRNVKSHNNLRDMYYRDILLGSSSEEIYKPTASGEISFAFKEANEHDS